MSSTSTNPKRCDFCGNPTRHGTKFGVCTRTPQCKREHRRRARAAQRRQRRECELCGEKLCGKNSTGVCTRTQECHLEHQRRVREAKRAEYEPADSVQYNPAVGAPRSIRITNPYLMQRLAGVSLRRSDRSPAETATRLLLQCMLFLDEHGDLRLIHQPPAPKQ